MASQSGSESGQTKWFMPLPWLALSTKGRGQSRAARGGSAGPCQSVGTTQSGPSTRATCSFANTLSVRGTKLA
jgi:hypothetical protein